MKTHIIAIILASGAIATEAGADTLATSFFPSNVENNVNTPRGGWNLGWNFSVSTSISVTQLGIYAAASDANGNPLYGSLNDQHQIALYSLDGTFSNPVQIAATTLQPNAPGNTIVNGLFQFISVIPLALAPGNYALVVNYEQNPNLFPDFYTHDPNSFGTTFTFGPEIAFNTFLEADGVGNVLSYPGPMSDGLTYGWFGPNMQYNVVVAAPEPSTLVLLVSMGAAAVCARRKRNQSKP